MQHFWCQSCSKDLAGTRYLHVLDVEVMELLWVVISPGECQIDDQTNLHKASLTWISLVKQVCRKVPLGNSH